MGFIVDEGSYLREPWNWLDFTVVMTSIMSKFGNISNISALRTFRLFRPLRSLNAIPAIKKLMVTVFDSAIALYNIFALGIFFYLIFSILAINLWNGNFHYLCRYTPIPIDGIWPQAREVQ